MTTNVQQETDAILIDVAQSVPAITDKVVSHELLEDGLTRRIAGQLGMIAPLVLIGWVATDMPERWILWLLIALQLLAQVAIAASATWLRHAVVTGKVPLFRHILWMLAEGASGVIWAVALVLLGPIIDSSNAALTIWVTILVTMTISILLAAPFAGIVFPLLGGFFATLAIAILFLNWSISGFTELAYICLTLALCVIAKAVNLQARANCRAEIGVVRLSERLEEELRRTSWQSRHDSLTGLLNRSALLEAIEDMGDGRASVILVDIDHFKAINDGFGHMQGDAVIAAVGACLSQALAEEMDDALTARWGGEEFIIVLSECSDAQARDIAETVRKAAATLARADWPEMLRLTVSLGVASGPANRFSSLFREADRAMYEAKALGRNRVVFAGDGKNEPAKTARAA
ncbi:GGDEF domain-containing protein [Parasphingorhabdus sp.]|uniref:GGDEF domain-containing protein n=1 Tax=Parasphingorhabdus sp. TaxID=2709688 RepID=UPI003001BA75